MRLLPTDRRLKWLAVAGYAVAAFFALAFLAIGAFPIGLLKPTIEKRLTARFGRPVTIASIERRDTFSLHPTILISGVRVPQPRWAGPGDLARIDRAELRIATLPLLRGRVELDSIALFGARLALVRAKDGRENWHGPDDDSPSRRTPVIERLTIADSTLSYRDAKRDRQVFLRLSAAPATGLVARGRGMVLGSPVAVAFRGRSEGRARPPGHSARPSRAPI